MIRWQLSTPIVSLVIYFMNTSENTQILNSFNAAIIANLIGSLIFFWVDLLTFSYGNLSTQWEVLENKLCYDCNKFGRVYRLALAPKYNRVNNSIVEFRCEKCSIKKSEQLRKKNILK